MYPFENENRTQRSKIDFYDYKILIKKSALKILAKEIHLFK